MPPNWQLPSGVTRGLWDYLHDPAIARNYDASLADHFLPALDLAFAERHFPKPGRLLDLGCGTGRLLIPFARQGCWTLGVDLSEPMLQVVGTKASEAGVTVQRLKANLVNLGCLDDQSFDYAACLFSTLGMVAGSEQRRRVLAHVHRVLRPGGKFILHVHNRWFNFWFPQTRGWLIRDTLRSLLLRRPGGDHVAPIHQGLAGLTLHLFTLREVSRLLRDSGFRLCEVMPLSLRPDGQVRCQWWFGWLRAYGYLLAAERDKERSSKSPAVTHHSMR
jgi:ubiquinone/menaquinone biosynthesis C-methylase UbiE